MVQVFDSWVGTLTPRDYLQYVQPYSRPIFDAIAKTGVPSIHFGTGTASLLKLMKGAGGNVIGIDWQTPLDWAWDQLDHRVAVQGNLDPAALFASADVLEAQVESILRKVNGRPGHIFNLGHGILPETPVDAVKHVVELVHRWNGHSFD